MRQTATYLSSFITLVVISSVMHLGCTKDAPSQNGDAGPADATSNHDGQNIQADGQSGGGDGPVQNTSSWCRPSCETVFDCPNQRGACLNGLCVQCLQDSDCDYPASPYKGGCNVEINVCRLCTDNAHCTAGSLNTGECDLVRSRCKQCTSDGDCPAPDYVGCDLENFRCQRCRDNSQCTKGPSSTPLCDIERNWSCIRCESDDDCSERVDMKRCDNTTGYCARCIDEMDCGSPGAANTGQCVSGLCIGCKTTMDCTQVAFPPNDAGGPNMECRLFR